MADQASQDQASNNQMKDKGTKDSWTKDSWTITILYNNIAHDPQLQTDWGFAALIEGGGQTMLFDTGDKGAILLNNMQALGVQPSAIDSLCFSHSHHDHTGGVDDLLDQGLELTAYLPPSFSSTFQRKLASRWTVVTTSQGGELGPGRFTTGEMGDNIREQALILRSRAGLVVITGCAHPGIVSIIRRADHLFQEPLHLVMGGFHLRDKNRAELQQIIAEFKRLGVQQVAPSHCTGEEAIAAFQDAYGKDFIPSGAGKTFSLAAHRGH